MDKNKKRLGFAMCGSFCTHEKVVETMMKLSEYYDIVPILSSNAARCDTRFGSASSLNEKIVCICGVSPVKTIVEAETFGTSNPLDLLLICPCTGNTVAKIANGITDTPVTMAAKAHLRRSKKLILALATNDALSGNVENIGKLMQRKNIYFVPMVQDDVVSKPYSLVADFNLCKKTIDDAENNRQTTPVFLTV